MLPTKGTAKAVPLLFCRLMSAGADRAKRERLAAFPSDAA